VKIRWYPTLANAVALPFPTEVNRREWDDDNYDQPILDQVGEVFGAVKKINHMLPIPGADGQHVCGTADQFRYGAVYDPTANYPMRADGLPVCCPGAVPKGIVWGGAQRPAPGMGFVWGGQGGTLATLGQESCVNALAGGAGHAGEPSFGFITPTDGPTQTEEWWYYDVQSFGYASAQFDFFGGPADQVTVYTTPNLCGTLTAIHTGPATEAYTLVIPAPPAAFFRILVRVTDPAGIRAPMPARYQLFF
jgi:hypothetical protein